MPHTLFGNVRLRGVDSVDLQALFQIFHPGHQRHQGFAEDVRKHFGAKVFDTAIPRSVRLAEAPGFRESAMSFDGMSSGATAYDQLTEEIHERTETRTWQRA